MKVTCWLKFFPLGRAAAKWMRQNTLSNYAYCKILAQTFLDKIVFDKFHVPSVFSQSKLQTDNCIRIQDARSACTWNWSKKIWSCKKDLKWEFWSNPFAKYYQDGLVKHISCGIQRTVSEKWSKLFEIIENWLYQTCTNAG